MSNFTTTCNDLYAAFLDEMEGTEFLTPSQPWVNGYLSVCRDYLEQLRQLARGYDFPDIAEEIHFFKVIKPRFVSKLLVYKKMNLLYLHCTAIGAEARRRFFVEQQTQIEQSFRPNEEFYAYYRSGHSYLDELYFTRKKFLWDICPDLLHEDADPSFISNADRKVSELLAHEQMMQYLEVWQRPMDKEAILAEDFNESLTWTAHKVDFIELAYGLQVAGVFNNGMASISEVVQYLCDCFNMSIYDAYHIYLELRMRKKNRTKFLDMVREALNKRMDQQDENPSQV